MFFQSMYEQLIASATLASMATLALNSLAAVIISCIVFLAYRFTYTGTSFSKKFMISLGMMTLVTTIIMNVISNNVALSLGMVGALSIIRFRTAIKDARDATYIFWCIAIGVACGVSLYAQALIGSLFILLFLLLAGQVHDEGRYLLVVRGGAATHGNVKNMVDSYFEGHARLRSENYTHDRGDLIYEVSARNNVRAEKKHANSISEALRSLEGVESVDFVQQTDDISR